MDVVYRPKLNDRANNGMPATFGDVVSTILQLVLFASAYGVAPSISQVNHAVTPDVLSANVLLIEGLR